VKTIENSKHYVSIRCHHNHLMLQRCTMNVGPVGGYNVIRRAAPVVGGRERRQE